MQPSYESYCSFCERLGIIPASEYFWRAMGDSFNFRKFVGNRKNTEETVNPKTNHQTNRHTHTQ